LRKLDEHNGYSTRSSQFNFVVPKIKEWALHFFSLMLLKIGARFRIAINAINGHDAFKVAVNNI